MTSRFDRSPAKQGRREISTSAGRAQTGDRGCQRHQDGELLRRQRAQCLSFAFRRSATLSTTEKCVQAKGGDQAVTEKQHEIRGLSVEELETQHIEQLPDREEMSLVNANLAAPINLALAANVLSDHAVAGAGAVQDAPITQGN
jgi:hypothetical protein